MPGPWSLRMRTLQGSTVVYCNDIVIILIKPKSEKSGALRGNYAHATTSPKTGVCTKYKLCAHLIYYCTRAQCLRSLCRKNIINWGASSLKSNGTYYLFVTFTRHFMFTYRFQSTYDDKRLAEAIVSTLRSKDDPSRPIELVLGESLYTYVWA